jgi:hypothetical protein
MGIKWNRFKLLNIKQDVRQTNHTHELAAGQDINCLFGSAADSYGVYNIDLRIVQS